MEFRNSIDVTGVDIPEHIIDYVLQEAGRTGSRSLQQAASC
jgi:hypothetical protein